MRPSPKPPPKPSVALSIVVPTYGGAGSLAELCARLAQMAQDQRLSWELWVIDDASPDPTPQVMAPLAAADPRIHYLRLPTNAGQHPATVTGLRLACGEATVTMDDDLQQAPESIPLLLAALQQGASVAIARFGKPQHALWRQWGSRCLSPYSNRHQPDQALSITSFKAFTREAADRLAQAAPVHGKFYLSTVMQQVIPRKQIVNVDVPHFKRRHGSSGYGPLALVRLAWRAIQSRAHVPPSP